MQTALGNLLADLGKRLISGLAQIPKQITAVGSSFEASMSNVAATMGITSAAAEFAELSDAAKAAGEATKFSASQAGEALNYLALAGYSAEKQIAALPTVLDLAAAGGMELAYASDLVTDSMSALGLATEDLVNFSDQMAKTAQKSNTNVAQLGEAILTVGGTAKTLSGGVIEMNTVLGILADNGIKGTVGGTALRNVILSLSAPTSNAAQMLEALSVTAFNANGTMRPLKDTFGDLNTALSALSDQDRTAALNEIFNRVDLKSVNALLGTSSERFEELEGYISDCEGAAADMAATMNDNLTGDVTIMQSALEGLGIAAYEKFAEPMRTAIQSITEIIGNLTSRMKNGDLSDSFDKIAAGFASLTESAVPLLADSILPFLVRVLGELADKAEIVVHAISTAVTALMTYKGIAVAVTTAQALLNSTIMANPYVLAASAIAALVAGHIALRNIQKSNAQAAQSETGAISEEVKAVSAAAESYREAKEAAQEAMSERSEELTQLSAYKSRLDELVDANGRIKGSYAEVKRLVEEINKLYPESIELIDGQIKGYGELSTSIDEYLERKRTEVILSAKEDTWKAAVVARENALDLRDELTKQMTEAENAYSDMAAKYDNIMEAILRGEHSPLEYLTQDDIDEINSTGVTVTDWAEAKLNALRGKAVETSHAWAENYNIIKQTAEDIADYENMVKSLGDSFTSEQSDDNSADSSGSNAQTGETAATESFTAFTDKWDELEHEYKMGAISSDNDFYAQKRALLAEYGDASKQEYWKYYEDIAAYDKDAAEALIEQQKDEADKLKAEADKKADELAASQKDAAQKAFSAWQNGFNVLVSDAESAFDDILSQKTAFADKLSDAGSLFTWETAEDQNGDDYKYLYLGDISAQTEKIKQYSALMKQLKERGASADFMAQFSALSFDDGTAFAEKLLDSKTDLDLYLSEWQEQQDTIAAISDEYYSNQVTALQQKFTDRINSCLAGIPQNALTAGEDAAQSFIDGISSLDLNELTLGVLDEADISSLGLALGERFVDGFSDGLAGISERLRDIADTNQLLSGAKYQYQSETGGTSASAGRNDTMVDTTVHVYLDGKEITGVVESVSSINNRIKGR